MGVLEQMDRWILLDYCSTPWKIKIVNPKNAGLEDDVPFQFGWFLGSSR